MKVFEFDSIAESYKGLLQYVLENGDEVSPRGMLTKEISPATVVINNPRKRVIDNPTRKLNYGFMVGELLWIMQGKNDLSISHYNKQWKNYSDDGETLNGAYGQRIFNWDGGDGLYKNENDQYDVLRIRVNQFTKIFEKLSQDNDSRQGTIVMFDPTKDFEETKDVPCTNLMRFTIRNGKLNMLVFMRSNDLIYGLPYDIFNFTMLQEIMAGLLGIEVGKYTHVVDSLHLYETHFELAKEIISNSNNKTIYDDLNIMDARLSPKELEVTSNLIFNIENITREAGESVDTSFLVEKINSIENEYWKSLAATIIVYNLRKSKREQEELNIFKKYITNEFSKIETIMNWKPLTK